LQIILQNPALAAGTHKIIPQFQIQQGTSTAILTQGQILAPQNVLVVSTNAGLGTIAIDAAGSIGIGRHFS
jgi:hypothetical protein